MKRKTLTNIFFIFGPAIFVILFINLLFYKQGEPIPSSRLPAGEYVINGPVIFHQGRCYEIPKVENTLLIRNVNDPELLSAIRLIQDLDSIKVPLANLTPVDWRAIDIGKRKFLGASFDILIIKTPEGGVYRYKFDNGAA